MDYGQKNLVLQKKLHVITTRDLKCIGYVRMGENEEK